MRRLLPLALALAFVATGCSSEPDMELTLVDYGIIAPDRVAAGDIRFTVSVEGVAHHTLTLCRTETIGACPDGVGFETMRFITKPEDARDPSVIPDETVALVLGAGWTAELEMTLEPGTYRMFCSIVNHATYGMDRILTVTEG